MPLLEQKKGINFSKQIPYPLMKLITIANEDNGNKRSDRYFYKSFSRDLNKGQDFYPAFCFLNWKVFRE
jgi:hypothetical protein